MSAGVVFTVSAPSGAGKTSLVKALLESLDGVGLSVSHTTRPRREGETDGVHYHFVSADEFRRMVADDGFVEHAEVFGNHYGTSREALRTQLDQGADVILEIDWQGAAQVRASFPQAVSIFILPPSREALQERLLGRGQDSAEVVATRTAGAMAEIEHYRDAHYLIVNERFDDALSELRAVVVAERVRRDRQEQRNAHLLQDLLSPDS